MVGNTNTAVHFGHLFLEKLNVQKAHGSTDMNNAYTYYGVQGGCGWENSISEMFQDLLLDWLAESN